MFCFVACSSFVTCFFLRNELRAYWCHRLSDAYSLLVSDCMKTDRNGKHLQCRRVRQRLGLTVCGTWFTSWLELKILLAYKAMPVEKYHVFCFFYFYLPILENHITKLGVVNRRSPTPSCIYRVMYPVRSTS